MIDNLVLLMAVGIGALWLVTAILKAMAATPLL